MAAGAWHHDDRRQALPGEPPGDPVPGGTFERATALMRGYAFAEGSAVHAIFQQDAPLQGRDMMLIGRFLGLASASASASSTSSTRRARADGRPVRVFGWAYRTLQGHLERGEMRLRGAQVARHGRGRVPHRRRSRRAHVGNLLVRIGFGLLGRREQLKFYDHTCEVMARRTSVEVAPAAA